MRIIDQDGMIRLPERPGLSIELDPAAVELCRSR
jgi:L-alanine-DL-glutamate epimerase-like enolase superfamily enzyme